MKKCEICLDSQDQHEIVQPFDDNYWVHNDCYGDAIAEAKFQEAEDRYRGFYEETPVDDGQKSGDNKLSPQKISRAINSRCDVETGAFWYVDLYS